MSPVLKFLGLGKATKGLRGAPMARVPAGWAHLDGKRRWVWGFELDLRPTSNADWLAFMQATGAKAPPWMFRSGFDDPEQPVVGLTLAEATAYARWAGKRLPRETEWARAAGAEPYPWGAKRPNAELAVFKAKLPARPGRPDGAGPFGHLDLVGNVWERLAEGVARGGFWGSIDPTLSLRINLHPNDHSSGIGFRCAR